MVVTFDGRERQLVSALDELMVHAFNLVLASGVYPDAWRLAVLVPLLKGVDLDCSLPTNYRGISLLASMSKMFANILERRLSVFQHETSQISNVQFGFTPGRRTLDPVFVLDTLIDRARAQKEQMYIEGIY